MPSKAGVQQECGFVRQQLGIALEAWRWEDAPLPSKYESLVAIPYKVVLPPGNAYRTLLVKPVGPVLSVGE